VRYSRGSKQHGIKPREYWEVVRIDQEKNQWTVLADDGQRATYDPRDTEVRARDLSRADWSFALLSAARGSTASEISEKLGIGEQASIIQSSGLCSKSGVTQNPEYDSRISLWRKLQKPYENLHTFLQI
jgi:hypothetical protein